MHAKQIPPVNDFIFCPLFGDRPHRQSPEAALLSHGARQ
jgi:hypothetical protein